MQGSRSLQILGGTRCKASDSRARCHWSVVAVPRPPLTDGGSLWRKALLWVTTTAGKSSRGSRASAQTRRAVLSEVLLVRVPGANALRHLSPHSRFSPLLPPTAPAWVPLVPVQTAALPGAHQPPLWKAQLISEWQHPTSWRCAHRCTTRVLPWSAGGREPDFDCHHPKSPWPRGLVPELPYPLCLEHSLVGHGARRLSLSLCWKRWFTVLDLHLAVLSSPRICSWQTVRQGAAGRWGEKHFNDFQQINFPAKAAQMGGLSFSNRKVRLKNKYVHSHVFAELPLGTSKLSNYQVGRKNIKMRSKLWFLVTSS